MSLISAGSISLDSTFKRLFNDEIYLTLIVSYLLHVKTILQTRWISCKPKKVTPSLPILGLENEVFDSEKMDRPILG